MKDSRKAFDVLAWKKGEGMFGYEVTLHFDNLIAYSDEVGHLIRRNLAGYSD